MQQITREDLVLQAVQPRSQPQPQLLASPGGQAGDLLVIMNHVIFTGDEWMVYNGLLHDEW